MALNSAGRSRRPVCPNINDLVQISSDMQDQVAYRVVARSRTVPNLLFVELLQALLSVLKYSLMRETIAATRVRPASVSLWSLTMSFPLKLCLQSIG